MLARCLVLVWKHSLLQWNDLTLVILPDSGQMRFELDEMALALPCQTLHLDFVVAWRSESSHAFDSPSNLICKQRLTTWHVNLPTTNGSRVREVKS
jgi:hypothetical protein